MTVVPNHPYQKIEPYVMRLLGDYLGVDLVFFRHLRHYDNGERYECCNLTEWLARFYESKFYRLSWLDGPPALYKDALFAWDYTSHQSESWKAMGDLASDCCLCHGVSIVWRQLDYIDAYEFSVGPSEMKLNMLAQYYPKELQMFIHYYMEMIFPTLMSKADKILLADPAPFQPQWRAFHWDRFRQSPCFQLTHQQQACLSELALGKTSKEISNALSISSRTVEYHLDLCRARLNVSNRMSMIPIWLEFQRMRNAFPYVVSTSSV